MPNLDGLHQLDFVISVGRSEAYYGCLLVSQLILAVTERLAEIQFGNGRHNGVAPPYRQNQRDTPDDYTGSVAADHFSPLGSMPTLLFTIFDIICPFELGWLIWLTGTMTKRTEEFKVSGEDLLKKVKNLINEGNVRKITVKSKENKTIVELPLTVGVVGVALAPLLAAVGAIAALVTECTIVVEREDK